MAGWGSEEGNWYKGKDDDPFLTMQNRQIDRGNEQSRNSADATAAHNRQMGEIDRDSMKNLMDSYHQGKAEDRADTAAQTEEQAAKQRYDINAAGEQRNQGRYGNEQTRFGWDSEEAKSRLDAMHRKDNFDNQVDPATGQTHAQTLMEGGYKDTTSTYKQNEALRPLQLQGAKLGNQQAQAGINASNASAATNQYTLGHMQRTEQNENADYEAENIASMPEGPAKEKAKSDWTARYSANLGTAPVGGGSEEQNARGPAPGGMAAARLGHAERQRGSQVRQAQASDEMLANANPIVADARKNALVLSNKLKSIQAVKDIGTNQYKAAGNTQNQSWGDAAASTVGMDTGQQSEVRGRAATILANELGEHTLAGDVRSADPTRDPGDRINNAAVEAYKKVDAQLKDMINANPSLKNDRVIQDLINQNEQVRQQIQQQQEQKVNTKGIPQLDLTGGMGNSGNKPSWVK